MKKTATIFITTLTATVFGQIEQKKDPADFSPEGYVIFEKIYGDLNKDGLEDCVMIIKGTDKSKIVRDEYRNRGELDQNRRGIIILFNKKDQYELVVKNYDCFSSENEDGGAYFPPNNFGPIVNKTTSIKFLTKKKHTKKIGC